MQYFLSLLLFSWISVAQTVNVPALRSPVVDEAGFLNEAEKEDLSQLAYEIYTNQGPQITILTVNDLQGFPIEEFSIRVAEKWQLGTKEKGNGLLIIVAKAERQMRIEVGEGIEGEITDYESNQYIHQVLAPAFKAGKFHDGLRMVMQDIAGKFNIQLAQSNAYVRRTPRPQHLPKGISAALPLIFLVMVIGNIIFGRRLLARSLFSGFSMAGGAFLLAGPALGLILLMFFFGSLIGLIGLNNILYGLASSRSGRGGFGGGFGGGGGGGWSGGGGGFSGGGSSGNW